MSTPRLVVLLLVAAGWVCGGGEPSARRRPRIKAGFAERDIIPTEGMERAGGHDARLTSYGDLEVTAGTRIVEASIALARSLTPGRVPEPPKVPPFKKPWEYGAVPPQVE